MYNTNYIFVKIIGRFYSYPYYTISLTLLKQMIEEFVYDMHQWKNCSMSVMSLDDDLLEISCKDLPAIDSIREYLQESHKNGVILQVQKNFSTFLKESCKEKSDLLNRHFW